MPDRKPCRWLRYIEYGRVQWSHNLYGIYQTCDWCAHGPYPPWVRICGRDEFKPERHCLNCPCYEPKEDLDGV